MQVYELEPTFVNLTEMTLKRPEDVRAVVKDEPSQPRAILNLLLLGLAGISLYSVVFTAIVALAPAVDWMPRVSLKDPSAARPLLTYAIGMVGALGICLPSFYFYGLLAGVRATMLQVVAISLHALARTGVILMGLLPVFVAAILGMVVLGATGGLAYQALMMAGVLLPFLAGLSTLPVMVRGFIDLIETIPEARAARRAPMIRLLALAWAVLYTTVAPVTLWAVKQQLEKIL
jgi:hypothetical protein